MGLQAGFDSSANLGSNRWKNDTMKSVGSAGSQEQDTAEMRDKIYKRLVMKMTEKYGTKDSTQQLIHQVVS